MIPIDAKIVVLGAQGVGKTSLVTQFISNGFTKHVSPTIGASFFTCKINLDNYKVTLQVWDTAGQERFRSMAPMYYRNSNAAMLVFDITSMESFYHMKTWMKELRRNIPEKLYICVIGNKCDLKEHREVSLQEAMEYATSLEAMYFETSAASSEGVEDCFMYVAKSLVFMHSEDEQEDYNKNNHGFSLESSLGNSSNISSTSTSKCC